MEGVQADGDEEDEVEEIVRLKSGKRPTTSSTEEWNSIQWARSNSFKLMIEVIGNYGPHLKSPSYYELRVPLLKKGHEEEEKKYGYAIISDG
ncbi:hypothetical protein CR513_15815, partial [Mucuna pruriens]